ncbi:5-methyltetrahydropteroyltriglutamate--homocysteine S-methyltransferase, partial [Ralstonia solanacearum species complex bacterium KE449]
MKKLNSHVVAGLIDGRNVWAANLRDLRSKYDDLEGGLDSLSVSTSVSLQHVPHTVEAETKLPADVATWFSFANEKVKEVVALSQGPLEAPEAYNISDRAVRTRAESERIHNAAVKARIEELPAGEVKREPAFAERNEAQKVLDLPQLPTTT